MCSSFSGQGQSMSILSQLQESNRENPYKCTIEIGVKSLKEYLTNIIEVINDSKTLEHKEQYIEKLMDLIQTANTTRTIPDLQDLADDILGITTSALYDVVENEKKAGEQVPDDQKEKKIKYLTEQNNKWLKECAELRIKLDKYELEDPQQKKPEQKSEQKLEQDEAHATILMKNNINLSNKNKELMEQMSKMKQEVEKLRTENKDLQELVNKVVSENSTESELKKELETYKNSLATNKKHTTCRGCGKHRVEWVYFHCSHMACGNCRYLPCPVCHVKSETMFAHAVQDKF